MVCLGNICRSPMAEGVFAHLVAQAGLNDHIAVDSAGTSAYHVGETAHPNTLAVLKRHGIVYNGRARQLTPQDLTRFDYVLAMDNSNLANIRSYQGTAETGLFLSYANEQGLLAVREVPDPYGTAIQRYEDVYQLVLTGSQALLTALREQHSL